MAKRWQLMLDRYNALSLRERALVLLAALGMVYLLWNTAVGKPLMDARKNLEQQKQALTQSSSQMALEEAGHLQAAAGDPEEVLRRERDHLKAQLQTLDAELAELSLGLVSAHQLASVLEQVLQRAENLQLRRLQTLPVEPLNLSTTGNGEQADVYKHSVLIAVKGSYFNVLDYLKTLESLGWRFYWEELRFQQEQYPDGVYELRVFTLSTDEGLLGV